ncbi:hypothetical protein OIU19_00040 [Pseudomonas sp. BT-42-2]|uniref:DUF6708 domain-containing protein n=1 Tax=Pseudomonas sp. BT-42-2 TaxID=2986927 RepID=UPI0021F6B082|nr:DUF6708 domain-containing protein [Pseudomonas sp. BT-42-2]MCV9917175.1 hypothetical protein [Pseudomonas sp. BT-42-2]
MYFFEWGSWEAAIEPDADKKENARARRLRKKITPYENEQAEEQAAAKISASETPKSRGPVYAYNKQILEIRSGMFEEKRGLIGILSLTWISLIVTGTVGIMVAASWIVESITTEAAISSEHVFKITWLLLLTFPTAWLYFKFGLRFTRLEMFTSRHLLIRFNRTTQQVYLHRPPHCGGIVVLPWEGVASSGSANKYAIADGVGVPLALHWSARVTGTLHPELAWVGKSANHQGEIRDEWEFIRRFMDEGPEGLPRPRITSHFPWPWQAFTPQFEGVTHYFRNASKLIKVGLVLISPAFLIIGTGHWLSLLLCWKPRWPKIIRQAGMPGKPVPPLTTLADYPPHIQQRLRENAHLWAVRPGQRPEKKPRKVSRTRKAEPKPS